MKSEADNSSLGKKTLRTSLGNIGHSIAKAFGKAFFIKHLCCDCALHARPLE